MKKSLKIFAMSLLTSLLILGCNQKQPEDINVSELETACEYVDAIEICINALSELEAKYGKNVTEDELSSEDQARFVVIQEIMTEIIQDLPEKHNMNDVMKCPNFEKVEEASKKYF